MALGDLFLLHTNFYCCGWKTGSSTGMQGRNSKDPHMGHCGLATGFIWVVCHCPYPCHCPCVSNVTSLPCNHREVQLCLQQNKTKSLGPEFLLQIPLEPTVSSRSPVATRPVWLHIPRITVRVGHE